jgi:hypothetical protein
VAGSSVHALLCVRWEEDRAPNISRLDYVDIYFPLVYMIR